MLWSLFFVIWKLIFEKKLIINGFSQPTHLHFNHEQEWQIQQKKNAFSEAKNIKEKTY